MARKYHVLMVREEDGQWALDFGDYDESVVKDELQDKRDHFIKAKDLHILTVDGDTQAAIDAAVKEFRSKHNAPVVA
jgi:hypothetical protein